MATGTVLSIDSSGTSGQVTLDESSNNSVSIGIDVLPFDDPNFPSTKLKLGNNCTFTITENPKNPGSYYAINLQPVTINTQTISGPYTGDLTANVGDIIIVTTSAAVVTGNLIINGGKIIIDQSAQVTGSAGINSDGILVARGKGKVMGGVVINSGGSMKVVNKGKIMGGISIQQGARLIVGNENGGGIISGAIDIKSIRHVAITADSTINCGG